MVAGSSSRDGFQDLIPNIGLVMDRSIKRGTSKPRFYFFETSERTMNNRSQGTKGEAREVERALMFQLLLGFKEGAR